MTATDILRAMLDERGVEWWPMHDIENGYYDDRDTEFVIDGKKYTAHEWGAKLTVYGVTPAQAIAVTLGANEYAIERNVDGSYECPICGCVVDYDVRGDDERIITMDDYVIPFNFCPNCGANVVDE